MQRTLKTIAVAVVTAATAALAVTALASTSVSPSPSVLPTLPPEIAAAEAPAMVAADTPPVPRLPRNFRASGRYVVPKLGFNIPFTWVAEDGNMSMVAGGPGDKIWFTNLIVDGKLYTYTYAWPGITPPAPPAPCKPIPDVSLDGFNDLLARNAHFAGTEILLDPQRRRVEHWRMGLVAFPFPLAAADIYVSPGDPRVWRQVLHFGLQNLYAPDMDEWIKLRDWKLEPGNVVLPAPCRQ